MRGAHREKQQDENQKMCGLGHEWFVFITGSNYQHFSAPARLWLQFGSSFDRTTHVKEDEKIPEEFY